jgi:hypothetical protein
LSLPPLSTDKHWRVNNQQAPGRPKDCSNIVDKGGVADSQPQMQSTPADSCLQISRKPSILVK